MVFYSGDGWWKMGGNSALYYCYLVTPRLGIKTALKPDRDFYSKFMDGVISIRNYDVLKSNLKALNIKVEEEAELWSVFDLGYKVSKSEMDNILNIREDRINQINQIVDTKNLYPSIAALGRKIAKNLYTKCNHATPVEREIFLNRLTQAAFENVTQIYLLSNDESQLLIDTLHIVEKRNEKIKVQLMLMMEISIFEPEEIMALETDITDMNTQIKSVIGKISKNGNNKK